MLVATNNNTKIVPKKKSVIKFNEELFYLGKDEKGLKCHLCKPHFTCGWYFSVNNIYAFYPNMRGISFTDTLGVANSSISKDRYLIESTCDLKELLNKINEVIPILDKFKIENDPSKIYDLFVEVILNHFVEIEKFVSDTSPKKDWQLKDSYFNQFLNDIKEEVKRKEAVIRYMIFNNIKKFGNQTLENYLNDLNNYRNKFIAFKIFD